MPSPKPWFLELLDYHSFQVMYSHGDAAQEAKCPGSGGKTQGPITAISSGAELAKAGTPSNVLLELIMV